MFGLATMLPHVPIHNSSVCIHRVHIAYAHTLRVPVHSTLDKMYHISNSEFVIGSIIDDFVLSIHLYQGILDDSGIRWYIMMLLYIAMRCS